MPPLDPVFAVPSCIKGGGTTKKHTGNPLPYCQKEEPRKRDLALAWFQSTPYAQEKNSHSHRLYRRQSRRCHHSIPYSQCHRASRVGGQQRSTLAILFPIAKRKSLEKGTWLWRGFSQPLLPKKKIRTATGSTDARVDDATTRSRIRSAIMHQGWGDNKEAHWQSSSLLPKGRASKKGPGSGVVSVNPFCPRKKFAQPQALQTPE